jgi:hypothetical protein
MDGVITGALEMRLLSRKVSLSLGGLCLLALAACSSSNTDEPGFGGFGGSGGSNPSGGSNTTGGTPSSGGSGQIQFGGSGNIAGSTGSGGNAGSCASQNAEAKVEPVYLAFAFDVSGSMGEGDYPWHDRTLKWEPVVSATKGFFTDPASAGLTASLTFFPDSSNKCEDASYATPDVPWTALPSTDFGDALDVIGSQTWRGGTPTLNVVRGTISSVQKQMQTKPGHYVLVLVTDGYPQGCDNNSIPAVVSEVQKVANTLPTYVVGVKNPPLDGAPDTVTDLNAVAMAGGTDHAYIIDTGNPAKTTSDFKATIDKIRGSAISCNVDIPAPPDGNTFDKQKVAVTYRSGSNETELAYDADCTGANGWHYDNPAAPKQILLCDSTCNMVQADPAATLNFEFACEPKITVPL